MQIDQCSCSALDVFSRKSGSNSRGNRSRSTERGCEEHGDGNAHGVYREEAQNGIHPVEDMGQRERVQRPPSNRDSNHVVPSGPSGQSGYCQLHGEGGGSIAWAHKKAFVPSPTGDMTEHVVTKRRLALQPRRKEPWPLEKQDTAKIIRNLLKLAGENCLKLRTAVMVAVGFAGFFRWNDLEQLKVGNITFQEDYAEFRMQKRKNQFRKGSIVLIESRRRTELHVRWSYVPG